MTPDILRLLSKGEESAWLYTDFSAILAVFDWQDRMHPPMGGRQYYLKLLEILKHLYVIPRCRRTSSKYRDRIYGLLGLAADVDDLDLHPDYSNRTTTTMILTQTARALIEKGNGQLEVLSLAQFQKKGVIAMEDGIDEQFPLPSWVPDWGNGIREQYRSHHGHTLHQSSASLDILVEVISTVLQSTLGLQGFLVDTIEEVRSYLQNRDSSAAATLSYWEEVAEYHEPLCLIKRFWHRSAEKKQGVYSNPARHDEALWRVPIGDLWRWSDREEGYSASIRLPSETHSYMLETSERVLEYCRIGVSIIHQRMQHTSPDVEFVPRLSQAEEEVTSKTKDNELFSQYFHNLDNVLLKMELRPYLIQKGYLGLAPSHTQPGDVLVIFSGGLVPYVLRPVTTDTDRYRFKPDARSQDKPDDQSWANSTTEAQVDVEDCHDLNSKIPRSPLYTEAEIRNMYERYNLHRESRPPPKPVVLPMRPDEKDSIYIFVGEAFCDGIMDGEFMERAGKIQDFFLI